MGNNQHHYPQIMALIFKWINTGKSPVFIHLNLFAYSSYRTPNVLFNYFKPDLCELSHFSPLYALKTKNYVSYFQYQRFNPGILFWNQYKLWIECFLVLPFANLTNTTWENFLQFQLLHYLMLYWCLVLS